jgi:hypothetical protein
MTPHIQSLDQMLAQTLSEKLPPKTVAALMAHPEIAAELTSVLDQPPFSADYIPREIEVLFDDITIMRWRDGQIQSQCSTVAADYQPEFMEWLVDGETAYFSIQNMEVINRIKAMPLLDINILEPLKEDLCKP